MVAAVGSVSLAEKNTIGLLANLAAFRTWAGVSTVAEAEALCHTDGVPDTQNRPYALIYLDPDGDGFVMELDATESFSQRGQVWVVLEQEVDSQYQNNVKDAERVFKNAIGQIIDEIVELSGTGDACEPLTVTQVQLMGPKRFDKDLEESALGEIQAAALLLNWES